jgi:choline-sulfatase
MPARLRRQTPGRLPGALFVLLVTLACDLRSPGGGKSVAAAKEPAALAAELQGYRPVQDLLVNRVHGIEHHGGRLLIDTGEVGFNKFVDGGWKTSWYLGEKDGDRRMALVAGLSSLLFVPLDSDGDGAGGTKLQDLTLTLTLKALVPQQKLSVFVNEKPTGTVDVGEGWGEQTVTVPAAVLQPGENRIRLQFRAAASIAGGRRSAAAIRRLSLGPAAAAAVPAQVSLRSEEVTLGGMAKRAVVLPGPGRLSFYVQVPAAAKLVLSYGSSASGSSGLVRVSRDGAAPRTLFEGPLGEGYTEAAWDLAPESGQAVRIDLVGRGGPTTWAAPRLMVKAPAPPALPKGQFDRIFIYMVDTLRADKVRVFNPKTRVQTPNYDAFAADATRFAWAHVPGTWSMPSHASILTGVYPNNHKATAHEARLVPGVPFIAELMKKGGYRTGLFSSNGYVSNKWGFDRGWDMTRNFIRESLPNGADYLWKTTKAWLDLPANKGKPTFLYLATVEPHVIYNPKKEFLAKYWDKPYNGPIKPAKSGLQLGQIKMGKLKPTATDKAYLEALYDAEVTQSDALFGAFIADLKARNIYDTSAVIMVSDHGDEFFEHGDVGHAQGVYQELVHIPLIIRAPGIFPAGRVIQADVEGMDVFPTVLDLAGLPIPAATQGSSLLPVAYDEIGQSPRTALSQNLALTRGLKVARYRFIHGGQGRIELYDEIEDPREQKDLARERPIAFRSMRNVFGLLYAYEARWRKRAWGTAANVTDVFYSEVGGR